ncbi:MAG: glycoside hydrolase family 20 zincin-like fold domain-containing protein, partial [Phycisphaerales bacterium]|nr:glycoside hydrolase family 20 zincin-like fold domain-containing protein [Phycisphaerales bacterium]
VTGGFWTGDQQHEATVILRGGGGGGVKSVLMQYQPGEKRPGPYCLTNNYRQERNIRTLLPSAPDGRYQYVKLDYKNEIADDDNPAKGITGEWGWAYDYNLRVEDVGGRDGWIPFNKGSLTSRPDAVFWQTANPFDYAVWGRRPRTVQIDLGQPYFVNDLDILLPNPNIINLEIWGKLKESDPWTLLHDGDGQYVEPAKRRTERRAYESISGLDSVMRYVMWRITPPTGKHDFPQLDGIQEFRVWGEPAGARSGIKMFEPWIPMTKAEPKKGITSSPDPNPCFIYPRPRKMTRETGWFIINPNTRILAQDDAAARNVATQIRDEIKQRWQLDIPIQIETPEFTLQRAQDDVIYLGQPWRSNLAKQFQQIESLEIPPHPQAYALRTTPHRAVILGKDADGLYWGTQSFMLAMRWHTSKNPAQNGLGVHCLKAEDWPTTLERTIFFTEGTPFCAIESEIPRVLDNIHLQTRFKWNAAYGEFAPTISWPPGRQAEVCRQARQRHHMELRPMLMTPPAYYLGGWDRIVAAAKDYSVVECSPDESPDSLGQALNLCPLNPRTYQLINARIDELLETYAHPSKIWLGGIVNHNPLQGSRWAACRNCSRSGKSGEELFAFFAEKIASHLRARNCIGIVEPHNIAFGDGGGANDPKWRQALIVSNFSELPKDFTYILPTGFSPAPKPRIAITGLQSPSLSDISPSFTCDGPWDWPSTERLHRSPMDTDIGTMIKFGDTYRLAAGVGMVEQMWYGSDKVPAEPIDFKELFLYGNCWHFKRDLPSWRAGDRPTFHPIDIRKFVNHSGVPTGVETVEPGRVQGYDLRYVPKGRQILSGVEFDLIDPAENGGKNVLMLGRPLVGATHPKDAVNVAETAGPIPVNKKLASIAFLTAGWQASTQDILRHEKWLMPTCRVIYDDGTWLVVDAFRVFYQWDYWNVLEDHIVAGYPQLLERLGWLGNSPTGASVRLKVNEWVNPYPEKTIQYLHYVTPAFEEGERSKRTNPECHGIIAISGVEPIEQDFNYWSKRADRIPLLPAIIVPQWPAVPVERAGRSFHRQGEKYMLQLKENAAEVTSTLELTPGGGGTFYGIERVSRDDCGFIANNKDYKPFGVVQSFQPAIKLSRIAIRGPTYGIDHEYSVGRPHRLDVTVEISEGGRIWQKIGELKGISGDADFLPIEFPPMFIRKIRITATAEPYRAEYAPAMAHIVARWDYPYFVWRILTPID